MFWNKSVGLASLRRRTLREARRRVFGDRARASLVSVISFPLTAPLQNMGLLQASALEGMFSFSFTTTAELTVEVPETPVDPRDGGIKQRAARRLGDWMVLGCRGRLQVRRGSFVTVQREDKGEGLEKMDE